EARVELTLGQLHLDVDLAVASGELVVLLGPNGAGKTTLLRARAGRVPRGRGPPQGGGRPAGGGVAGGGRPGRPRRRQAEGPVRRPGPAGRPGQGHGRRPPAAAAGRAPGRPGPRTPPRGPPRSA